MTDYSQRDPAPGVADQFWQRWSPRAFEPTTVSTEQLARIIDAARWSPSCFNAQPWRFHTSSATTFNDFFDLLVEGNQGWAKDAAVLGFITAKKHFAHNGEINPYARFDAGAAWMALALQAQHEGLHSHGMGGIHADKAADYLGIDTSQEEVIMGFAIGRAASVLSLTDEQRAAETPNTRHPLDEVWLTR